MRRWSILLFAFGLVVALPGCILVDAHGRGAVKPQESQIGRYQISRDPQGLPIKLDTVTGRTWLLTPNGTWFVPSEAQPPKPPAPLPETAEYIACEPPLFSDRFAEAKKWSPASGSWTVENGKYEQGAADGAFWTWAGDPAWEDYEVQAKVRLLGGRREASLVFRVAGTGDLYNFNLCGGADRLTLAKIINGHETYNVAYVPWTAEMNRWYRMRVAVQGQRIRAFLDDRQVFDCDAPDMPSQGRVGLRTYFTTAQFADVIVKPISHSKRR